MKNKTSIRISLLQLLLILAACTLCTLTIVSAQVPSPVPSPVPDITGEISPDASPIATPSTPMATDNFTIVAFDEVIVFDPTNGAQSYRIVLENDRYLQINMDTSSEPISFRIDDLNGTNTHNSALPGNNVLGIFHFELVNGTNSSFSGTIDHKHAVVATNDVTGVVFSETTSSWNQVTTTRSTTDQIATFTFSEADLGSVQSNNNNGTRGFDFGFVSGVTVVPPSQSAQPSPITSPPAPITTPLPAPTQVARSAAASSFSTETVKFLNLSIFTLILTLIASIITL